MRDVGRILQARARQLGLTDTEVARRLGLAQARYSKYATGTREPDLATFVRICRELSITPNEALGFAEPSRAAKTARARLDGLIDGLDMDRLLLLTALAETVDAIPSTIVPVAKSVPPKDLTTRKPRGRAATRTEDGTRRIAKRSAKTPPEG